MRVLVVEDDPLLAVGLGSDLHHCGCTVVGIARSAEDAIDLIARTAPDLVILDIGLVGRSSGLAVLRSGAGSSLLFVILTGDPEAVPADVRGVVPVVEKPVSFADIEAVVRAARDAGPPLAEPSSDMLTA